MPCLANKEQQRDAQANALLRWLAHVISLSQLPSSSSSSSNSDANGQSQSRSPIHSTQAEAEAETQPQCVHVLLQEYFKCPYEEKCRMDPANRRFCKRCRLRRCFEIGMRKEYILSEDEKHQKRIKIEQNRCVRLHPFVLMHISVSSFP